MIFAGHVPYYEEILSLPGFLKAPLVSFGFQDIHESAKLGGETYQNLREYFARLGINSTSIDLFDPRSELRYDMNYPVPDSEHDRYSTFIDIGSLEHVFDTRQCLENCLRMVAMDGHIMLHTPVNGYYGHGLHVFHPQALLGALGLNGFHVVYKKFSGMWGEPVGDPEAAKDVIIWIVARKERAMGDFVCPQQGMWIDEYPAAEVSDQCGSGSQC